MYNKEAYEKLKTERPEVIKANASRAYEKLKETNPEKLKEFRKRAYENLKASDPERLKRLQREAAARYYEAHREEVLARRKANREHKIESPIV